MTPPKLTREAVIDIQIYWEEAPEIAKHMQGQKIALCDLALAGLSAQWQPMSSCPEDELVILHWREPDGTFATDTGWRKDWQDDVELLAWMELPKPPEGEL